MDGTSVSEIVTAYWTTLLFVCGCGSTTVTLPAAVTPGSASKDTVAAWPTLILLTSASVKSPTICRRAGSAMSMKPPDPPDADAPPCDCPRPPWEDPPDPPDPPPDAPEEPPTAPLTAVTTPAKGALITVPATARLADR